MAASGSLELQSVSENKSHQTETPQSMNKEHELGLNHHADSQHEAFPPALSKARSIALVLTLTGASFLNILSTQSIVIILPVIRDALALPESRVQWIVSSYSLTFGCFLLLSGRLGDVFGKRLVFLLGSGLATLTNIANPFVTNEIAFYLCRGLAGIGGAANVPTAIGILGVNFRSGKTRNYAFATYAAGSALGGAIGNILAGLISTYTSWKWVFTILAGFSAMVTVLGVFVIPQSVPGATKTKASLLLRSVDWIGGFLITTGLIALLFALTQGNIVGWSNVYIPVLIVIAALLIATFVAWQWYQEARTSRVPLLKPSLFKNRRFAASVLIMMMFFSSYNVFVVFATYFWQDYQGLNTLQTTIHFIPQGVAGTLIAICMSFLISRISTCTLLVSANVAVAISCLLFAIPIPSNYSYWATGFPALILSVIGADVVWPCMTLFTSLSVSQSDQAMGGAINQSAGQIGRAVGLAITTALQMGVMQQHRVDGRADSKLVAWDDATLAGLRAANWYNFGLLLVSAAITFVAFRDSGIVGKVERDIAE